MKKKNSSKSINIIFSGSNYNDLLGNGLFQIIFYTFNGRHVNLLTSHEISEDLKKKLIEHSKSYNIELTFTNLYKTSSKGLIYILRTLHKKFFVNSIWRLKVITWPFRWRLRVFLWRLKVITWPFRWRLRVFLWRLRVFLWRLKVITWPFRWILRVFLWRLKVITWPQIFSFKNKVYLFRHNINKKMNDLVIYLKKKMKITGRLIDSKLKLATIIIFKPLDLLKYIILSLLLFSFKVFDFIIILIKKASQIPNKILGSTNSVFKFLLKNLAELMYLFVRSDFTPRAKECLNHSFICVSPFDQSMLPIKYKQKSTLIIADFLSLDFPDDFDANRNIYLEALFEKEARDSRNVVCFSKHVRDRHLIEGLGIDKNKIIIIPHTLHDLSPEYNADTFDNKAMINKAILTIQNSKVFSNREKKRIIRSKYFLSASTYRKPYKGIKNLLLFNKIINYKDRNFFIVSTHIPDEDKNLFKENRGVFPSSRVNNSELSALYVLSYASIHVSKFEGGVNVAPFSEAVSVGRPCIFLSNLATQEANLNKIELGMIEDRNLMNKFNSNDTSIEATFLYLIKNYQTVLDNQKKYYNHYSQSYSESVRNKLWEHALNRENQSLL